MLPLNQVTHRPWPLPATRWAIIMRWHDLLFLHWPVRPEVLRPLIPDVLEIDTYEGWAWIGVVPFRMTGVRPHYLPALGQYAAFPEINVRTYVKTPGRSGVWFFSLDATSWLAVRVARAWYGLPYYDARIDIALPPEYIHYHSVRVHRGAAAAEFQGAYCPSGPVYQATPGALDWWLTERYCLYAVGGRGQVGYGDIHHSPWPLQAAEVSLSVNTMTAPLGIELPSTKPLAHFARQLTVLAWRVLPLP
jgi:hypothetical protein